MEKEFVTYEQALALKELGFDEPCFGAFIGKELRIFDFSNDLIGYVYNNNLIFGAPTYSQAFRWFRKVYNKLSVIDHATGGWYFVVREIGGTTDPMLGAISVGSLKSYEEAESTSLDKLIGIVKEK